MRLATVDPANLLGLSVTQYFMKLASVLGTSARKQLSSAHCKYSSAYILYVFMVLSGVFSSNQPTNAFSASCCLSPTSTSFPPEHSQHKFPSRPTHHTFHSHV